MTTAHAVFTSSTPTTRPDWCDSVGRWRVSHVDELRAVVEGIDAGSYAINHTSTASGRKQLFAGVRDNRVASVHQERLENLLGALKVHGFKVRRAYHNGHIDGVIVTDWIAPSEA